MAGSFLQSQSVHVGDVLLTESVCNVCFGSVANFGVQVVLEFCSLITCEVRNVIFGGTDLHRIHKDFFTEHSGACFCGIFT